MASNVPVRSNSLPSRPHPLVPQIKEHISHLRTSETSTSSSISHNLNGLQDLYDLVDGFLQLSHTQQVLSHDENIDELLDASLRLLDMGGTTRDAVLQTKQRIQELQSLLRRRLGDSSGLASEVEEYFLWRKKTKRVICKSLRISKSKSTVSPSNSDAEATVGLLREVKGVSLVMFKSLLSYIYGTNLQSKTSSWCLVSKLVRSRQVACQEDTTEMNEFEKVDAALSSLIKGKSNKMVAENIQNMLAELESNIQELEEGLNCLLRRLIKTRVSLLNILNH